MIYAIVNLENNTILKYEADFPVSKSDILVPEGLDQDCLKAVLVNDVITLVEDPVLVAAKAKSAKDAQISELNASMNADIDAQMFITYETKDRITANAIQQSWADILLSPSDYTPAIFPSVNAAVAFVTPKLAAARAFNIWRIGRVAQRDAAIAAL